jgi:hypothetical protein
MSAKVPPFILENYENYASGFARPLSLLFNKSLLTCVFPDRWKIFYVTPITDIQERHREVGILSAIPECFELLAYRTIMYECTTT